MKTTPQKLLLSTRLLLTFAILTTVAACGASSSSSTSQSSSNTPDLSAITYAPISLGSDTTVNLGESKELVFSVSNTSNESRTVAFALFHAATTSSDATKTQLGESFSQTIAASTAVEIRKSFTFTETGFYTLCVVDSTHCSTAIEITPVTLAQASFTVAGTTVTATIIKNPASSSDTTIDHFKLYYKSDVNGDYTFLADISASASWQYSRDFTNNTIYYFSYKVCSTAEESSCSAFSESTKITIAPATIAHLYQEIKHGREVEISWDAVTGATYYKMQINDTPQADKLTELTYLDSNIALDAEREYQVQACHDGGCSNFSDKITSTSQARAIGTNDFKISVYQNSDNSNGPPINIQLNTDQKQDENDTFGYWSIPATTGVIIFRNNIAVENFTSLTSLSFTVDMIIKETGAGIHDRNETPGWTMNGGDSLKGGWKKYRLVTTNSEIAFSVNTLSQYVNNVRVFPFQATATDATDSSKTITLSWTAQSDKTFKVHYASSENGTYTKVDPDDATSYAHTGLGTGDLYYYKLESCPTTGTKRCNLSPALAVATAVPQSAPANLTTKAGSTTLTIDLSWDATSGADRYRVYRDTSTTGASETLVYNGDLFTTTYTDTVEDTTTTYYYKVEALNHLGAGSKSTAVSATAN